MMTTPRWVVRPTRREDLGALVDLAAALGSGMTTLPADPDAIALKIHASVETFGGRPAEDPQYLLVLEDLDSGKVLGISGVYPRIGDAYGFFSYKVTKLVHRSDALRRRVDIELLTLSNDFTGSTEVGTLAVHPLLRGTGAGRLLARSRYMLIAAFPKLFAKRVMAELRGWQEADGTVPFWEAIGARFFDLDFAEADRLSATMGNRFIAELFPRHPIYAALLPEAARQAVGRPHRVSAPAMKMLIDEDFAYDGHIDVFDGGPQLHVARDRIRLVGESVVCRPKERPHGTARTCLISNTDLAGFRVMLAGAEWGEPDLERLQVTPLDEIRAAPQRSGNAA